MDIIFIILCSIIFLSPYALVSKVLAGMILERAVAAPWA